MNYLTQHLIEAIEINKERKKLYAKISNNRSLKISKFLIFFEKLSLVSSYILDNIAKYWQKRNVPIMVHEFIPMDQTPSFKEKFTKMDDVCTELPELNTREIQKKSMQLYKSKDYQGLFQYLDDLIEKEMSQYPKHFCMIRHILESVRRSAYLIEKHIERAQELNVRNPELFCRYLLKNQIMIIHSSRLIDVWAFPLQKEGIPIVFQDVPHIPARVENY